MALNLMKSEYSSRAAATFAIVCSLATSAFAQPAEPPPFGPGGPGGPGGGRGPGGFGGVQEEVKLVKQFDKDADKRLNAAERKAAREFLAKEREEGRGPRGFGGGRNRFGRGEDEATPEPGQKLSPADVKSFPNAPLYDSQTLRTLFFEFENTDWEKELADFNNTDVEVPATLTVDGKAYHDVGVHFRGASSFGMVREGRKRSLNVSVDFVHEDQQVGGYRTLNLLNSHEDPTFLRTVLYFEIARDYIAAPKANFVRVVINGESWGIYVNTQQFNKDFVKEWFGTTKGARWKAPGSPGGRASLAYLGDDVAPYKRLYEIKTKDDPKAWADFVKLCKVLNETSPEKLEESLSPLLDIDGALKFLALENVLINNDGYWIRRSDYSVYQDEKGRFHIIPHDANETFAMPGGPGFGGGGPGGRGGFGPAPMLATQMLSQGDADKDQKLTKQELAALADAWFSKLDPEKAGKVTQEQFADRFGELLPAPPGGGPPGGGRGFGPSRFMGPGFFSAVDADKNGSLTRDELKQTFAKWLSDWDTDKSAALNEEKIRAGLTSALPQPNIGGPGGGRGPGAPGGPGGAMPRIDGVKLDPLIAASDADKPLISKLLAVPALRTRYLGYVRDIAEKWLDWQMLGRLAQQYQALIAADVKADTRKLSSTEDFARSLTEDVQGRGGFGGRGTIALKNFAQQRREYLLNLPHVKDAPPPARSASAQ